MFTADGDVFGGFSSEAVTKKHRRHDDLCFSLKLHGRCKTSHGFALNKRDNDGAHVTLFKDDNGQLVHFEGGDGCIELGKEKSPM